MDVDFSTEESQKNIKLRCEEAKQRNVNIISPNNRINLVVKLTDSLVVKFGIGVTAGEARALEFASRHLDPAILKVPLFVQYFTSATDELWTTGYLVMAFVEGTQLDKLTIMDERLVTQLLRAIQHINSFGSVCPGPLDGGHARGPLWSEDTSGQSFESRQSLQEYLNVRLAVNGGAFTVDVADSALRLCHMDIAPRNIIVGLDGSICLLDWACAGFYPPIFETWALEFESHIRPHPVLDRLVSELAKTSSPSERIEIEALFQVYAINQSTAFPNSHRDKESDFLMQAACGNGWNED